MQIKQWLNKRWLYWRHLRTHRYPCDADDCLTCRTTRKQ